MSSWIAPEPDTPPMQPIGGPVPGLVMSPDIPWQPGDLGNLCEARVELEGGAVFAYIKRETRGNYPRIIIKGLGCHDFTIARDARKPQQAVSWAEAMLRTAHVWAPLLSAD